jgi:hypothetical protein
VLALAPPAQSGPVGGRSKVWAPAGLTTLCEQDNGVVKGWITVGGALSVLPLPIWPWVPDQSLSHYMTHAVSVALQVPILVLSLRRLRGSATGTLAHLPP